jgi:hypothetical protein
MPERRPVEKRMRGRGCNGKSGMPLTPHNKKRFSVSMRRIAGRTRRIVDTEQRVNDVMMIRPSCDKLT